MPRGPRWVRWAATGCTVAVVGAAAYLVLDAGPSNATTAGLRTATVMAGSVTQSIDLSGSVERVERTTAAFRTSGRVTSVAVQVGEHVRAGQVLARMDTSSLSRAVTVAQADLVAAQAALDAAASSSSATTPTSTGTGTPATTGAPAGGRPGGTSAGGIDTAPLRHANGSVEQLLKAADAACAPVLGGQPPSGTPTTTPTVTPTPNVTPTTSATPSSTASPTPTSTASPTPRTTATANPAPTGPTTDQVTTCVQALSEAMTAERDASSTVARLADLIDKAATALQNQQSASGLSGSSSGTGASGGSAGGSAQSRTGSTAGLEVSVLKATQALAGAQQDLAGAVLRAPIAGTVGSVALVAGEQASASSGVVIVGSGAAVVTVDLPLSQLGQVRVDQDVTVTPAGTTDDVPGLVQSVGVLPSSTTSTTPSYPVQVAVSDAPVTLASGSMADARITLATATDVLTIPVSAISGVSSGTGSVRVVDGSLVRQAQVTIGAVGGGLAEIQDGLSQGQVVVLADPSEALPTANTFQRRFTGPGVGGLTGTGGISRRG